MIDYICTLIRATKRYPRQKGESFISYWRFWMHQAWQTPWYNNLDIVCLYDYIKKWRK